MKTKLNRIQALPVNFVDARLLALHIRQVRTEVSDEFALPPRAGGQLIRLALDEAEALAWQTPFPHLFFPALAREKAQAMLAWQARQDALRQPEALLAFAA